MGSWTGDVRSGLAVSGFAPLTGSGALMWTGGVRAPGMGKCSRTLAEAHCPASLPSHSQPLRCRCGVGKKLGFLEMG